MLTVLQSRLTCCAERKHSRYSKERPQLGILGSIMPDLDRRETLWLLLSAGAGAFARDALAADAIARATFVLLSDFYRIGQDDDGRGGFARLAAVVGAERARADAEKRRLFFVHAGDTLSPSLMSSVDFGAHMIALFNELGLDAFVPGNHELDFGKEVYLRRMGEARFPILAANLRDAAGSSLPRHEDQLLVDVGEMKLALIGAAYDRTPIVSNSGDLVFADTRLTLRQRAEAARAAGADLVVAIIHADKETGAALMNGHVVDLVLSGHNHDLHIDFDGRTALMESQADASYLSVVDLDVAVTASGRSRRIAWWPSFRPIDTAKVAPDPGFAAKVATYEAGLAQVFDLEIATLVAPLDSRSQVVRSEEAAIGNLVADAMRKAASAEIAICNGGGIRGNRFYPVGTKLKRRDLVEELPFGNKTVTASVTGKAVVAALENGFSQLDRPSGRFPQVSGLVVMVDRSAPLGQRVRSVAVGGEPLDPSRLYRLATNDFLARGGDGYWMLAGEMRASTDSGVRLVAQDVIAYIEASKLIEARTEGRIVFV
jgi:5'-nucleotidase/UDP-sugar diphosphatase